MQNNITIYDLEKEIDDMETTAGLFCTSVLLKDAESIPKDMIIKLLLLVLKTDIKFYEYNKENYDAEYFYKSQDRITSVKIALVNACQDFGLIK